MKTAGAVYKKLREVKYRHLVELYKKYLRRSPEFCKYNRTYTIEVCGVAREIKLCMLHQPNEASPSKDQRTKVIPHLLEICNQVGDCSECNAFINVHTKESVRIKFEEELKNINIKARKYPDICALEWVLEQSSVGIPPFNWVQKIYYTIKKYLLKNRII